MRTPFGPGREHILAAAVAVLAMTLLAATPVRADEPTTDRRKAPADYGLFESHRTGAYFIPKSIKEKYDRLVRRFAELRIEIDEVRIGEPEARREIDRLQAEIDETIRQIDRAKVYIPAAPIHTRTETSTFPLAEGDLLLVGDFASRSECGNVEIRGGEGPDVRCVVEKTVLAGPSLDRDDAKGLDPAADFDAIRLVARRSSGDEMFGFYKVAATRPDLKPQYDIFPFKPFVDRAFTFVALTGLKHDQGNRQVEVAARNERGEGIVGSEWRRHAKLTLIVPKCRGVAVWGGLAGLRVRSLRCPLMVLGGGDPDLYAPCEVEDLGGPLTAYGLPFRRIRGVRGDVSIVAMAAHDRDTVGLMKESSYEDVQGGLTVRFCRVDLVLGAIGGRVDVENDFGRTTWRADRPIAAMDHRIVSQSGSIDLRFAPEALGPLTLTLATECGRIRRRPENVGRFETHMVTGGISDGDSADRSWLGLVAGSPGRFEAARGFAMLTRLVAAMQGKRRPQGVDIISRAGTITYEPIAGAAGR